MAAPVLTATSTTTATLSGDLTVHSVAGVIDAGEAAIRAAGGEWILDLSGVDRFSSAGVALLLNWMRFCLSQKVSLRLDNIPADMQAIIDVCDLESVFAPLTGK